MCFIVALGDPDPPVIGPVCLPEPDARRSVVARGPPKAAVTIPEAQTRLLSALVDDALAPTGVLIDCSPWSREQGCVGFGPIGPIGPGDSLIA